MKISDLLCSQCKLELVNANPAHIYELWFNDDDITIDTPEEYETAQNLLIKLADAANKYEKAHNLLGTEHEEYLDSLSKDDKDILADLFNTLDEVQVRLASNWNKERTPEEFDAMCAIRHELRELIKACGDFLAKE